MKGLMVPLLFFVATGIVAGQQNTSDIFDSPRTPVSPEPDDSFNATGATDASRQTQTNQGIGSQSTETFDQWIQNANIFELAMSTDQLWSLVDGKSVEFEFKLEDAQGNIYEKDTATAVRLRRDRGPLSERITKITGFPVNERGQTVLEFELTPSQVNQLRSGDQNFAFKIPENQRGAYDVVRVVTKDDQASRNVGPSIPGPGVDDRNDFIGPRQNPTQPRVADRLTPWRPDASEREPSTMLDPGRTDQQDGILGNRLDRLSRPSGVTPLTDQDNRRTNLGRNGFALDNAAATQERSFREDRVRFDAAARMLKEEQERNQKLMDQLEQERYARQQEGIQVNSLLKTLETKIGQLENQNRDGRVRALTEPPLQRTADRRSDVTLDSNRPGLDDGSAAPLRREGIAGTNPQRNQSNNPGVAAANTNRVTNPMMFFLFLISVGLNLYLAMLARSFYVRYGELASELRETFASSA